MDDLKPCPFCGCDAEKETDGCTALSTYWRWVCCSECYAQGPHILADRGDTSEETEQRARKAWNARTTPPGYALVPIEPTIEMIGAMEKEFNGEFHPDFYPVSIWKAAIKALTEGE